ncbi:MAG: hypothetical protein AB1568_05185 [Thermodesulfobacteriota bacterium]
MTPSLLTPFFGSLRHRLLPGGRLTSRGLALLLLGLAVVIALHLLSLRVIGYFHAQNELGIILSLRIFQMAWILLFAMQVFSCMVSAVSSFFLAQDNEILFAAPIAGRSLYTMRFLTTTLYTSWMMIVFSLPIFAAYGRIFAGGPAFWLLMPLAVLATTATATGCACLMTLLLVQFFPARRTKDIVMYLSLLFGIFIYIVFRLLRPEDLVNPDRFGQFIEYLSAISRPAAPWLPAGWAAGLLSLMLLDGRIDWLLLGLVLVTPLMLHVLGEAAMERFFASAYSKSQESFGGHRRFSRQSFPKSAWRAVWRKEAAGFVRDSAEWSQLFMIGALVVVYLYNFKLLPVERSPMEKEYITNLIAYLNIGLAGFIAISLAARFVYPAVGGEGGSFILIQASPLPLRRYLLAKYWFYALPFALFVSLLIFLSNRLLQVSAPMQLISLVAGLMISLTVVALALGFGAMYADFRSESRAAAMGGFGAILFLFTAAAYELIIIFGGAAPTYLLLRKWLRAPSLPLPAALALAGVGIAAALLSFFLARTVFRRGLARLGAF